MDILHSLVLLCCVIAAYSADNSTDVHKGIAPAARQKLLSEHTEEAYPNLTQDNLHLKPTSKPTMPSSMTHEPAPITSTSSETTTSSKSTTTSTTALTTKTSTVDPTTSTTSSKTTMTPPSTTQMPPTPAPKPEVGNWTVDYPGSNRSCIVMQAEIELQFIWMQENKTMNATTVVPASAVALGACGNDSQWIALKWNVTNQVRMDFVKTKDRKFEVQNVSAILNLTVPDQDAKILMFSLVNQSDFPTPLQMSYKCIREQTLKLKVAGNTTNTTSVNLKLSHVQMQAFRNSDNHKFDSAFDCDGSVVNDTVPIVVGSILIVMILMILAAYLLSRRRCQARGYLSI